MTIGATTDCLVEVGGPQIEVERGGSLFSGCLRSSNGRRHCGRKLTASIAQGVSAIDQAGR